MSRNADHSYVSGFLKKLGHIGEQGVLDNVAEGDVVEIFSKDHVLLLPSKSFHSFTTWSLHELLTQPWHSLFYRDPEDMEKVMAWIEKALCGEVVKDIKVTTLCKESKKNPMLLKHTLRHLFPIKNGLGVVGFLCVSRVEVINV
ncbi:hypothetical protein D3C87_124870 [compost metagenome]